MKSVLLGFHIAVWAFGFFLLVQTQTLAQCHDVLVAADGSGDYSSIQEAIEAAPSDLTAPYRIFIRNGIYDEKLFIEKNFITLIGEDRDSTIITTAVLRRVWRETNPSDWGAATINIASDATDLTIAHLTVRNNFADVFPEFPDNNDHTFAIRGGGHRVIILDCNIVATGGDTLSLWNTGGGMFYHKDCYFEGYVDYVAPRGYCYITDSEFFGHNLTASIWHDGSGGEDHKFVLRNCRFDGVQGFPLGRYHKDAAFYLLDCYFSPTMNNQEIYHTGSDALMWGERTYFHNCHRDFFDWTWFRDNLEEASGSPGAGEIDAFWTFNGEWDPEASIGGLIPRATLPYPADASGCQMEEIQLMWVPGFCVDEHLVYFGTEASPAFIGSFSENTFDPGALQPDTRYFWRVDEVSGSDTTRGETWSFLTARSDALPTPAFSPDPPDGSAYYTENIVRLDWDYTRCNTEGFDVYFGSSPESLELLDETVYPGAFVGGAKDDSTYYWRVDSRNSSGVQTGTVWSFILNPTSTGTNDPIETADPFRLKVDPNPVQQRARLAFSLPASGKAQLLLYRTDGTLSKVIEEGEFAKGTHTRVIHNGPDLIPGAYFCVLRFAGLTDSETLILK